MTGGIPELSDEMRERLDRLEEDLPADYLPHAVEDLRLLYAVYSKVQSGFAHLEERYAVLSYEHEDSPGDGYFLDVQAPQPEHLRQGQSWSVTISQWIADEDDDDGEVSSAHGDTVLECALSGRPAVEELDNLLALAASDVDQMVEWAKTPVGQTLAGTAFAVTNRDDEQ